MSAELLKSLQEMDPQVEDSVSAEACCKLADAAFKEMQMELAFSICRAGVHKHLNASDKLCKRYLFMLEMLAKNALAGAKKADGPPDWRQEGSPPRMLFLRELYDKMDATVKKDIAEMAGEESVKPGEKFVLMKQLSVMVVGFSPCEWRVLLEKQPPGSDKMQMISGLEEAVMRGLSQSEGTPDSQTELKAAWNSWARKLCEVEGGAVALRSKCLLQQTVLQLQQQQYAKALDSSNEVLALLPENKHAKALLATSQQKAGKKKAAGVTVTELCADFQKAEDPAVQTNEELGHPLELTVSLLVEMHRTKDALKLLSCLLARVLGPRQQVIRDPPWPGAPPPPPRPPPPPPPSSSASRGCTRSTD